MCFSIINYDQYIGYASQRVAVDIDITIKKLKEMILNDSLRKEMGKHGKERAKSNFSWSVVLGQYNDLRLSLDDIRLNNNKIYQRSYIEVLDPSNIFKSYPTLSLSDDLSLFSKTEILDKEDKKVILEDVTGPSIQILQITLVITEMLILVEMDQ